MAESRRKLRQIGDMAHGVYLKSETDKGDSWRDLEPIIIFARLLAKFEDFTATQDLEEVLDIINLLEMFGAKLVEKEDGSV